MSKMSVIVSFRDDKVQRHFISYFIPRYDAASLDIYPVTRSHTPRERKTQPHGSKKRKNSRTFTSVQSRPSQNKHLETQQSALL